MNMKYLYWTNLDIKTFSILLNKKYIQNSHKLYWLSAVIKMCRDGEISFNELADRMIVDAWYTVSEYHVHLGPCKYDDDRKINIPQDAIEVAVNWLIEHTSLNEKSTEEEILSVINDKNVDTEFNEKKQDVVRYAPYRLLSPFLSGNAMESDYNKDANICKVIKKVNDDNALPYTINWKKNRLERSISIHTEWGKFFISNQIELLAWVDRAKIEYLQGRNPEVPGMVYKIAKGEERRDLKKVRRLWDAIFAAGYKINDMFTKKEIDVCDYEIDHFIPWTYIANNELWNLFPIGSSVNLEKSNNLPPEEYIDIFVEKQKELFDILRAEYLKETKKTEIISAFEECKKSHIFAQWAVESIYSIRNDFDGESLRKHIIQLRESAAIQGFQEWKMKKDCW